jgi:hypothetical protein
MSIELYILPPLFSLPSMSGSCIAALTLCNLSLDKSLFLVIESWDLSLGLPALKVGETWYRGYTNIKSHLAKQNDIDAHLTPTQKADVTAWGSLIEDLGDTLAVLFPFRRFVDELVELIIRIPTELPWRNKTRNFAINPISLWIYLAYTITSVCSSSLRRNWND